MKKYIKAFISDNERPILETFGLRGAIALFIWIPDNLVEQFRQPSGMEGLLTNILVIRFGSIAVSVLGIIFVIWKIHDINKEYILFQKEHYHQYPYIWFCFCAFILGFKKCNLIGVPIYLQFRLSMQHVFAEYPLDANIFSQVDAEEINVMDSNDRELNEVNFIFEDTYRIDASQIPAEKRSLYTVKISRNHGTSGERHYSPNFINIIENQVRSLPNIKRANVFATTNPKNNIYIASGAFKSGGRGNIEHLYVYQQEITGNKNFNLKGYRIF